MSRKNVELVQTVFEAWNARDLDTLRDLYDRDVIVWAADEWPEPGPFVGREAVIRQGEQLRETWDSQAMVVAPSARSAASLRVLPQR